MQRQRVQEKPIMQEKPIYKKATSENIKLTPEEQAMFDTIFNSDFTPRADLKLSKTKLEQFAQYHNLFGTQYEKSIKYAIHRNWNDIRPRGY